MIRHHHLGQPIGYPVEGFRPPPVPPRTAMEGRWARLEPLSADDHAGDLHAANALDGEGRMWTYMSYGPFGSLDEYAAWVRSVEAGDDPMFYAISVGGRPVGVASYLRIAPAVGTIEVGHIAYSLPLQRTTAATEAVFLMADRVFESGYRRFEWKCDDLNQASKRAAIRLGFTFEGVHRQATIYKGRNRDTAWFSILDHEWPSLREGYVRWLDPSNFDEDGRQLRRLFLSGERTLSVRSPRQNPISLPNLGRA